MDNIQIKQDYNLSDKDQALMRKGRMHYDQKLYLKAMGVFAKVLWSYPGFQEAEKYLGLSLECFEFSNKAADQGNADAQYSVGFSYYCGRSVPKDLKKSVEYFEKAANLGHAGAECNLGFCYANGIGVPKDVKKAVRYFHKSYVKGCKNAECDIGIGFGNGATFLQDLMQAIKYYQDGLKNGELDGSFDLFFPVKNLSLQDCSDELTDELLEQVMRCCTPHSLYLDYCWKITRG